MFTKHLPKKYTPIILVALALLTLLTVALVADLDSRVDFLWNNKTNVATSTDETTAETVNTSNWKTYRNEGYGFEFKYPEGWILEEHYNYSISLTKAKIAGIQITITEKNPQGLSIDDWWGSVGWLPAEYVYYINGIKMLSRTDLTKKVFGSDLISVNFGKGKNIYELDWLVDSRGDTNYPYGANNISEADPKYKVSRDEFIDMVSTFKFFK